MTSASPETKKYFDEIKKNSSYIHELASKARKKGFDPKDFVEIKLAENLAERVVGLISALTPQITNSGAIDRILELEKKYAPLDWRVALTIAYEVSTEKFCEFKDKKEAMETGIRTGFAYITLGVVSAPLEGFTNLDIKKTREGKDYFCVNYAGPVRAAGGTGAAVSVLIADYVRKKNGYAEYDPTDKEVKRCAAELEDYHEYVTNLQYFPSKEESDFLMKNLPVEISGDPSEKYEISSALLKDLPRIQTNKLRSGYCLIHSSCIPLKAPKVWKQLKKWGGDFEMSHWNFLGDFVKLQEKSKSKGKKSKKEDSKISPDYTYIKDLVGGRPVIGHPMKHGALRLRYGRARNTGFSAQAINPATMYLLNEFVGIGTQLKTERPGKAAGYSSCDTIDGPIIKLRSGDVVKVNNLSEAKKYNSSVEEIIYAGDVLINYGDFYDRNHKLLPSGYCEERWVLELKKADPDLEKSRKLLGEKIIKVLANPFFEKLSFEDSKKLCDALKIPLHPEYTFYWSAISREELEDLRSNYDSLKNVKRSLELIGIPHKMKKEEVFLEKDYALALKHSLNPDKEKITSEENSVLKIINAYAGFEIRDKAGTFIGARMGRPEKAKMRKLTGSPHSLFPVGEEGGRLRSIQSALDKGFMEVEVQMFMCGCGNKSPFRICEKCGEKTTLLKNCDLCGESTSCEHEQAKPFFKERIKIQDLVRSINKNLDTQIMPDLIKGVRGVSNKEKITEHLTKGFLRAKHGLSVNKDGTVRYDASEMPLTHFKPSEIRAPIKKLKELGYEKDIYGNELKNDEQILELKVQDIVLPCCPVALEEPADEVLFKTTKFIDETLKKLYGLKSFYNLKNKEDLIGHLTVALAPHTSAGMVTRIIGFSQTQGFYAHPYVHAAIRRDCDGDEACLLLLMDGFLNFSKTYLPSSRGSTMDAPLVLTSKILPAEVDDMIFNLDTAWEYPLEFYEACDEYKTPYDVKIPIISDVLGKPEQYEKIGYTHSVTNLNEGVLCSAYKLLPSMDEKVDRQMDLAVKLRAVDEKDVAKLVIDKHFIRDTKGNLRKFSLQEFRCVACNTKYRRPPLQGRCVNCKGKVIFTISQGSIIKYLDAMLMLADKYKIDFYTSQVIDLTKKRIEMVFGREKEKQTGLADF